MNWDIIKDVVIIFTPIIVGVLSYKQNKKTKRDIENEVKAKLQEIKALTEQETCRIESLTEQQKQLISWSQSTPQTNQYIEEVGVMRQGSLATLIPQIKKQKEYMEYGNITKKELIRIRTILKRVNHIPEETDNLYAYEVEILLEYYRFLDYLDDLINQYEIEG